MPDWLQVYPEWLLYSFIALFGLLFGSFFSMVTWRLPRMVGRPGLQQIQAMSLSRSRCSSCNTDLTWKQLFPVFSWLFYRGKCAFCKTEVSSRYLWIELFTLFMTLMPFAVFGFTEKALVFTVFMWFLVLITVIDIEHQLILDHLSLPLMWLGLLANAYFQFIDLKSAVIGAAVGYASLWLVFQGFKIATGKKGMGYGDFKLFAALGAWLGWQALPDVILIAAIIGIVWGLFRIVLQQYSEQAFAFGPFLVIGAVGYIVKPSLLALY